MRITDLTEQTISPVPSGMSNTSPAVTGNVSQLQDPKMAAANLAQQQQQKTDAKKQLQDQITQKQKELADLQRQLSSIK